MRGQLVECGGCGNVVEIPHEKFFQPSEPKKEPEPMPNLRWIDGLSEFRRDSKYTTTRELTWLAALLATVGLSGAALEGCAAGRFGSGAAALLAIPAVWSIGGVIRAVLDIADCVMKDKVHDRWEAEKPSRLAFLPRTNTGWVLARAAVILAVVYLVVRK